MVEVAVHLARQARDARGRGEAWCGDRDVKRPMTVDARKLGNVVQM